LVGDVLDSEFRGSLPRFDIVLAWGFLHRVSDPITFLTAFSELADTLSLEWRAPAGLFSRLVPLCIHNPARDSRRTSTAKSPKFDLRSTRNGDLSVRDAFLQIVNDPKSNRYRPDCWRLNEAAVVSILSHFGWVERHRSIISREFTLVELAWSYTTLCWNLIQGKTCAYSWSPSKRVHLLLQRPAAQRTAIRIPRKVQVASWDGRWRT
jgi:hypothetical protein